jgi:hypothetical protein
VTSRSIAPEVLEEVGALLTVIDPAVPDERVRAAAIRLAAIVRREALEDRQLLAHVRVEEPEWAPALERLLRRG